MSNNRFLKLINSYMEKQEFMKCNSLLKKEIVYIYTNKVRKYNKDFYYSTTVELLEDIKEYLPLEECIPYVKFYNILNEDCMEYEKTQKLLDLYKSISNSQISESKISVS